MDTLALLPAMTYKPPSPVQVHRSRRSLNTIIEDDEESNRGSAMQQRRGRDRSPKKADWLSPLSDHFPTPRGNHFMSAPIPESYASSDASFSPAPSSAPWTRDSFTTDATEFDDLYDVSSDEESRRKSILRRQKKTRRSSMSASSTTSTSSMRNKLPALVIPSAGDPWPGHAAFKLMTSPVPPTPPPKVPMSPAIFKYLQSQEVPSCSAPPSLDGSLSSEQMAALSAPPTPNIGNDDSDAEDGWGGVQLHPAAMATLQALSGGDDLYEEQPERVIELTHISPALEMQQSLPPLVTNIRRNNSIILSPEQQRSFDTLTRLEIPSPGGFFSALSPRARHTWHLMPITPESAVPPSSTTAEHFYKTPWTSSAPVERILEMPEMSETMSDGLPTARPTIFQHDRPELRHENSDDTITCLEPQTAAEEEMVVDEITGYADGYFQKLNNGAVLNHDRTGMWLAAQSSYLAEIINPTEARDDEAALMRRASSRRSVARKEEVESCPPRKTVRFSEIVTTANSNATVDITCPIPKAIHQESAYYRAFQDMLNRSRHRDTFIHRTPRFEALQSQRVSFPLQHRAQLLGKYQLSVVPMSAKRRMSANVARGDEITPEDPEKLKKDKEFEALQQMAPATWIIQAIKLLNGGRLLCAPIAKRLARLSSMGPKVNGMPRDRARILNLGGQATCDWAWNCAVEYPNTKVYTVTTKALRQLSNSNIRGPKNHRLVAVDRLVKLPFRDNQFDLVSAREIYSILRERSPNGENEWDACLAECLRILKPGGYLEFNIMDSDIVNAGPQGSAKSVEFGFSLKTLGYDPTPTKSWLKRLNDAGFVNVKRAWIFLPMGAKLDEKKIERDEDGNEIKLELEAMVSGSIDNAASVAGIVGAWAWEKWAVRCRVQLQARMGLRADLEGGADVGAGEEVKGVHGIIEEGRKCGAGWRTMSGWARKPLK